MPLEGVDVLVARLPELAAALAVGQLLLGEDLRMDLDDEHVFVIGAIM
jgi:hypothetical protein